MAESTATTYLGYTEVPEPGAPFPSIDELSPTIFTKACDIIDYPDLSSPAERIETTTLSNEQRVYIKGLPDQADQVFTANFDAEQYLMLKNIGDKQKYWAILFGDSGALFYFKGQSSVAVAGAGVGEVRTMTITLYPNEEPVLDTVDNQGEQIRAWEYAGDVIQIRK